VVVNEYPISEPVFVRKSLSIGLLTLIWTVLPSIVALAGLYAATRIYDVRFGQHFVLLTVVVLALCGVIMQPARNLGGQLTSTRVGIVMDVLWRWFLLLFVLLVVGYATQLSEEYSRRVLVTWGLVTPLVIIGVSLGMQAWIRRVMFDTANVRKVVFAGCNETSQSLAERINGNPQLCMSVSGFFDDRSADRLGNPRNVELHGGLKQLPAYIKAHGISVIFIALPIRHLPRVLELLDDLRDTTASIYYVPDIFMFDLIQARTGEIMGVPVVAMCETPFYGLRGVSKRMLDVIVSLLALLLLLPVLAVVALLVRFTSPGPVIFRQRRYGLDSEQIVVYKFRTMTVTEDGDQIRQATTHDDRTTPVGRILRRYSLDELPQLINVVQGRMSLVGPRPHAVAHNEMYRKLIKGYMVRHKVLPGITGLAQVNGHRGETRNVEDMEARVQYDLEYLRRWSILLDLKIIGRTALMMFRDPKAY